MVNLTSAMKYFGCIVFFYLALLGLNGCSPDNTSHSPPEQGSMNHGNESRSTTEQSPTTISSTDKTTKNTSITLALSPTPLSTLPIVAHAQGFFRQHHLDVKLVNFSAGKLALDAVIGGNADFATVAETPVMYAGLAGLKVELIATIVSSSTDLKLIARSDRFSQPSELKGKKVSAFIGTAGEFFMDAYLKKHRLSRNDVEVVSLRPPEMVTALVTGDIDAFFSWEPNIHKAKQQLSNNAWTDTVPELYTLTFNIAAQPHYLDTHAKEAQAFLAALVQAEAYVQQHPEHSMALVSQYTGMEISLLTSIWSGYQFGVRLEQHLANTLLQQAQWATGKRDDKPKIPKYQQDYLNDEFLSEIDRSRVNLEP